MFQGSNNIRTSWKVGAKKKDTCLAQFESLPDLLLFYFFLQHNNPMFISFHPLPRRQKSRLPSLQSFHPILQHPQDTEHVLRLTRQMPSKRLGEQWRGRRVGDTEG